MQEKKQNISPVKQRILQYVDYLGISKREFYEKIGVSRGTLESSSGITEDVMAKFIAAYPTVAAEWLVNGNGEMHKPNSKDLKLKDEQTREINAIKAELGIPLIPLDAFAGFGVENGGQIMEYECEKYVIPNFREAEFLIQVKGGSMYPKYSSGDIVACKKLPLNTFFQWNKVYVIDSEQGILIKRVKQSPNKENVLLVSENPRYDPFEIPIREINSLAIVIGVIRLE